MFEERRLKDGGRSEDLTPRQTAYSYLSTSAGVMRVALLAG
jgi:hypothetical protein